MNICYWAAVITIVVGLLTVVGWISGIFSKIKKRFFLKQTTKLKELKNLKDIALLQPVSSFPAQFYRFAEIFLTERVFDSVIKKILQEYNESNEEDFKVIQEIDGLVMTVFGELESYMKKTGKTNFVIKQVGLFALDGAKNVVVVALQVKWIKDVIKLLESDSASDDKFLKKIEKRVIHIEQLQEELYKNNLYQRRMGKVKLYGALQRIFRIYKTYNPKVYRSVRDELVKKGRNLEVHQLDIQYKGLRNCIDADSDEKWCYDESFRMAEDKEAIQSVYDFAEQEISPAQHVVK